METQRKAVKEWLESGKTITARDAYTLCGSMRLSAIIFHLKNERGMPIADKRIYEEGTNYSKYWLTSDPAKKKEIKDFLLRGNSISEEMASEMWDINYLKVVINELREEGINIVSKKVKPLCGKEFTEWYVK